MNCFRFPIITSRGCFVGGTAGIRGASASGVNLNRRSLIDKGDNMGARHFHVRSRFPAPRFEMISVRTAREIGPACLFRFKSFEMSAENQHCLHSHKETHFRIGRRERCLDSRSVELAMRFTTASLRNTLCRSGYVHKRSSKMPHRC